MYTGTHIIEILLTLVVGFVAGLFVEKRNAEKINPTLDMLAKNYDTLKAEVESKAAKLQALKDKITRG